MTAAPRSGAGGNGSLLAEVATAAVVPRREQLVRLVRRLHALLLRQPVLSIFALALLARAIVVTYVAVTHGGFLFEDDHQYVVIAAARATGHTGTWDDYTRFVYDSNRTLTVPMMLIFRVFGVHAVLGQIQVALFGALTAALVTRLALELPSRSAALAAGAAVAVLPSQVLFSSLTLKDALVWASLAGLGVLAAVIARTRERRRLVLLYVGVVIVLLLLAGLRKHTLVVAGWSLFLTSWVGASRLRLDRIAVCALLAVLVPLAVGAGIGGERLFTQGNALETQRSLGAEGADTAVVAPPAPTTGRLTPDQVAALKRRAAALAAQASAARVELKNHSGRSSTELAAERARLAALQDQALRLARQADSATPAAPAPASPRGGIEGLFGPGGKLEAQRNLAYLPQGLSVMLLQPYPWRGSGNARLQLARAETLLWYPLLALAAVGLLGLRRWGSLMAFPLVVGGGIATMWALVEGNFGTAYRHRGEFVWAVAVLAAGGLCVLATRRRPSAAAGASEGSFDGLSEPEQARPHAAADVSARSGRP